MANDGGLCAEIPPIVGMTPCGSGEMEIATRNDKQED